MPKIETPEQLKTAKERERSRRLRELRDVFEVMSTEAGRRFVWRLLGECRVFLSTYDEQPVASYYKQGRRAVGLVVYNDVLEACPELFWDMQDENISKETNNG